MWSTPSRCSEASHAARTYSGFPLVPIQVPSSRRWLPNFVATMTWPRRPRIAFPTSSIAIDSHGTIYYTTTDGNLFRFDGGQSSLIAQVTTVAGGDSGLLGMALRDDITAVVHYTTPNQIADVLSTIDLTTGKETI